MTTQKYFNVACIEGVGRNASSGSSSGSSWLSSRWPRWMAKYHARAPMPASRTTKLINDQTTIEPDGRLSISASDGQLLV